MAVAQGRKVRKQASDRADDATSQVEDRTDDATEGADEKTPDTSSDNGRSDKGSGGEDTLMSELKDAIREAALEVLKPVARKATTSAAKLAVTQGPSLVKDKVMPTVTDKLEDAGGAGALAKGLTSKGGDVAEGITEKLPFGKGKGGKGKAATGTGRGRRLPVQVFVDVAVPIDVAYDQYTQFEEFPRFMHRVEKIEQNDDAHLTWHENVWGVRRKWDVEILEQVPCERIAWRSEGGEMVGVVTFHELSERLTRVYVNMDFQPKGLLEKSASGMRHSRRALKSDLMRFKAYVEMKNEPSGAWRGEIEDGEVVDEQDRDDTDRREDSGKGRGKSKARSRDEEDEDEFVDDDDEDEDEVDEKPRSRKRREEDEDEDDEEFADEDEEESKPARRRGRFARSEEEDEDDDEDDYDEPEMEEDGEPEEEEAPKKRRRTRAKSTTASRRK